MLQSAGLGHMTRRIAVDADFVYDHGISRLQKWIASLASIHFSGNRLKLEPD